MLDNNFGCPKIRGIDSGHDGRSRKGECCVVVHVVAATSVLQATKCGYIQHDRKGLTAKRRGFARS